MKSGMFDILVLSVLAAFVLSGCMVGPDYSRPKTVAVDGDEYVWASGHLRDINSLPEMYRWWENFADPVTASLVEEALVKNYDLMAAAARVLEAEAILTESRGRKLPEIDYGLSRDRSKRSFNFSGTRFSILTTTYTQEISASYVLDLFGKLKRAERASWAELLATDASRQAITNSVIATVIRSRIEVANLEKQLALAQANTEIRRRTRRIVELRYERGLVGPVDVRLARENLAASEAFEPQVELLLVKAYHALDVLLGRKAGVGKSLPDSLGDLPELSPVPVGLPVALLDRRPDIKAAEFEIKAANERIGVSIAQLYPDLTFTGNYGASGDRSRDITSQDFEMYSAIMRLVQPIFRGGQLRARVKASKARYQQLAAKYAGTVANAVREVEDALVSEELLLRQLGHVQVRFEEAQSAEQLARQRYQRGVEQILTVLESERRRRFAETELVLLQGRVWTNRVNLFLALGGNWVDQKGVAKSEEYSNVD